jgi:hypothetical protein
MGKQNAITVVSENSPRQAHAPRAASGTGSRWAMLDRLRITLLPFPKNGSHTLLTTPTQ